MASAMTTTAAPKPLSERRADAARQIATEIEALAVGITPKRDQAIKAFLSRTDDGKARPK
ncbi:MAG: hypothetical protein NT029_06820 [Armatimonadetes bacterium]|nr:hypothetical protein [Armatimonadota bacterium]